MMMMMMMMRCAPAAGAARDGRPVLGERGAGVIHVGEQGVRGRVRAARGLGRAGEPLRASAGAPLQGRLRHALPHLARPGRRRLRGNYRSQYPHPSLLNTHIYSS
jgi:hypothetical protein